MNFKYWIFFDFQSERFGDRNRREKSHIENIERRFVPRILNSKQPLARFF